MIPDPDELLIEWTQSRDDFHYFIYPFAGRLAHEGLAALTAHRISQRAPRSFTLTMNDYGFALNTPTDFWNLSEGNWKQILSPDGLIDDLLACLNSTELARRQFREIARIAGLIFQGYPGAPKSMRQLQASSSLFYEVFSKYDPKNKLLAQARREGHIERRSWKMRQSGCNARWKTRNSMKVRLKRTAERLTPLAFPLLGDNVGAGAGQHRAMERPREADGRATGTRGGQKMKKGALEILWAEGKVDAAAGAGALWWAREKRQCSSPIRICWQGGHLHRFAGIAVPETSHDDDLQRLEKIIRDGTERKSS